MDNKDFAALMITLLIIIGGWYFLEKSLESQTEMFNDKEIECVNTTEGTDSDCDSCFHAVYGVDAIHPDNDYSNCKP